MDSSIQNDHDWFAEQIAAYLAGGLSADDQARFDAHAAACPSCAAALAEATSVDAGLRQLFHDVRPDGGFESRVIQQLRQGPVHRRWTIHPLVIRAAGAAAAAVLLAGIGYGGNWLIENGRLQGLVADARLSPKKTAALAPGIDMVGGTALTHQKDGQLALFGDGGVQFDGRVFVGYQQDNIYRSAGDIPAQHEKMLLSPQAANDSTLLPTDDSDGEPGVTSNTGMQGRDNIAQSKALTDGTVAVQHGEIDRLEQGQMGREQTIEGLVKLSRNQISRDDYGAANGVLNQIKALDPKNEYATGVQQFVQDRAKVEDQRRYHEAFDSNFAPQRNGGEKSPDLSSFGQALSSTANSGTDVTVVGGTGIAVTKGTSAFTGPVTNVPGSIGGSTNLGVPPLATPQFFKPGLRNGITLKDAWSAAGEVGKTTIPGSVTHGLVGGLEPTFTIDGATTPAAPPIIIHQESEPAKFPLLRGAVDAQNTPHITITDDDPTRVTAAVAAQNIPDETGKTPLPGALTPPPAPVTPPPPPVQSTRKIIRHGEMTFDVDSFDSASLEISKIVAEEQGFVATTSSEKLPNGKVTGTITVRVPPDHLDTLVLKLRGLGDLKGQKIAADDVTREYTDMESELRAAQAMQERMLDIIKTGKGEVKDLVEAEKELGVWREKVEKVTGEINYYNNLISLSTLDITLSERDIRQAALATEVETVSMGIETQDVAKSREDALKAIDDAKGRIIQSTMKQFDAGQLAADIIAEVPPDAAGPVIDRLTQLGRVARRDVNRQQTTANGAPVAAGVKVERKDTQFTISLYNLANIAPRETANLTLACNDVETTYKAAIDRIIKAGGRVIDSSLNKPKSDQVAAAINFDTPETQADAVLTDIQAMGEVLHLTETENPDAANVTASKRGFVMTLSSLAMVPPREVVTRTLMPAGSVADAYHTLLAAAQTAGGGISTSQLQETGSQGASAQLVFDVPRAKLPDIEKIVDALSAGGKIISRQSTKSSDTEHTVDSKVGLAFSLVSSDALAPRLTTSLTLAVADVPAAYRAILAAAESKNAKISTANLDEADRQNIVGLLDLMVPKDGVEAVQKAIADAKPDMVSRNDRRALDPDTTTDAKVALLLTIKDIDQIPPALTSSETLAVPDVPAAYKAILAAAQSAGSRIAAANLTAAERQNIVGQLNLIVPKEGMDTVEKAIADSRGGVVSRDDRRSPNPDTTTDAKVLLQLTIKDIQQIPPRQTTTLGMQVPDPEKSQGDLSVAVLKAGGRVLGQRMGKDPNGNFTTNALLDVPLPAAQQIIDQARGMGTVRNIDQIKDPNVPEADFTRARIEITLVSESPLVGNETGLWSTLKSGLGTSIKGLLYSLELIIIGLCLLVPWAVLIWLGFKGYRRIKPKAAGVEN